MRLRVQRDKPGRGCDVEVSEPTLNSRVEGDFANDMQAVLARTRRTQQPLYLRFQGGLRRQPRDRLSRSSTAGTPARLTSTSANGMVDT